MYSKNSSTSFCFSVLERPSPDATIVSSNESRYKKSSWWALTPYIICLITCNTTVLPMYSDMLQIHSLESSCIVSSWYSYSFYVFAHASTCSSVAAQLGIIQLSINYIIACLPFLLSSGQKQHISLKTTIASFRTSSSRSEFITFSRKVITSMKQGAITPPETSAVTRKDFIMLHTYEKGTYV